MSTYQQYCEFLRIVVRCLSTAILRKDKKQETIHLEVYDFHMRMRFHKMQMSLF